MRYETCTTSGPMYNEFWVNQPTDPEKPEWDSDTEPSPWRLVGAVPGNDSDVIRYWEALFT